MGYKRKICLNELTKLEDEKIIPAPVLNFQTDSCSLDDCTSKMRVKVGITLVAIEEHLKSQDPSIRINCDEEWHNYRT